MKLTKKLIALFLSLMMILSLGCVGAEETQSIGTRRDVNSLLDIAQEVTSLGPIAAFANTWTDLIAQEGIENNELVISLKDCDGTALASIRMQEGEDLFHLTADIPALSDLGLPNGLILGSDCAGLEFGTIPFVINYSELGRLIPVFLEQEMGLNDEILSKFLSDNLTGITNQALSMVLSGCFTFSSLPNLFDGSTTTTVTVNADKALTLLSSAMTSWINGSEGAAAAETYAKPFRVLTGKESTQENWKELSENVFASLSQILSGKATFKMVTPKEGPATLELSSTLLGEPIAATGIVNTTEEGITASFTLTKAESTTSLSFSMLNTGFAFTLDNGTTLVSLEGAMAEDDVLHLALTLQEGSDSMAFSLEMTENNVKGESSMLFDSMGMGAASTFTLAIGENNTFSYHTEGTTSYTADLVLNSVSDLTWDGTNLSMSSSMEGLGVTMAYGLTGNTNKDGIFEKATGSLSMTMVENDQVTSLKGTLELLPESLTLLLDDGTETTRYAFLFEGEDANHLLISADNGLETIPMIKGEIADKTMTLQAFFNGNDACLGSLELSLVPAQPYTLPENTFSFTAEDMASAVSSLLQLYALTLNAD